MRLVVFRHAKIQGVEGTDSERLAQGSEVLLRKSTEQLIGFPYYKVYTGSLLRTRETAEIIAKRLNINVVIDPRLNEISRGVFNKYPLEIFYREWTKHDFSFDYTPREGESINSGRRRIFGCLQEIISENRSGAVIVSHSGVIANILMSIYGFTYQQASLGCGERVLLDLNGEEVMLTGFRNSTPLTKKWCLRYG